MQSQVLKAYQEHLHKKSAFGARTGDTSREKGKKMREGGWVQRLKQEQELSKAFLETGIHSKKQTQPDQEWDPGYNRKQLRVGIKNQNYVQPKSPDFNPDIVPWCSPSRVRIKCGSNSFRTAHPGGQPWGNTALFRSWRHGWGHVKGGLRKVGFQMMAESRLSQWVDWNDRPHSLWCSEGQLTPTVVNRPSGSRITSCRL